MVDETWQDRAWAKRGETLRKLAEDTGVPQDVIDCALSGAADAFESAVRRARLEHEAMAAAVELALPVVCAEVTRDFLRPALRAAGFAGEVADRYELAWESAPYCGGFTPGSL